MTMTCEEFKKIMRIGALHMTAVEAESRFKHSWDCDECCTLWADWLEEGEEFEEPGEPRQDGYATLTDEELQKWCERFDQSRARAQENPA